MCRLAAHVGEPAPLSTLLYDPPHSLEHQAYAPTSQLHGNVNVDGTGVAWWPDGDDEPLRYVTTGTPWGDPNLAHLAPRLHGRVIVAAVRGATPGVPHGPGNVAPFVHDGLAFVHNGWIGGFRDGTGRALLQRLPDERFSAYDAVSDSLAVLLLVAAHRAGGAGLGEAVQAGLRDVAEVVGAAGRPATLNLLVTDGRTLVATRTSCADQVDTLHVLEASDQRPGTVLVASEPLDDDPAWRTVPEHHLVTVDAVDRAVTVAPLATRWRARGAHVTSTRSRATITNLSAPHDLRADLEADVRAGLLTRPRTMPPKYFYDRAGSELFERITRLPEYYPTRTETEILESTGAGLVARLAPSELVELGSGSSRKTRLLLEAMHDHGAGSSAGSGVTYSPIDVSRAALVAAADALTADHPWLNVAGYVGDFSTDLHRIPRRGRRLVAFLGSTIGNLEPAERHVLLTEVRTMLEGGDRLLLGVDLVKDEQVLVAAYDDAQGVTAAFNRNLLDVLNRELDAGIDLEDFAHVARFDPELERIEMHLRARRPLVLELPTVGASVEFEEGETIRTEISCKFRREVVERELSDAGLELEAWHTDTRDWFALAVAAPR